MTVECSRGNGFEQVKDSREEHVSDKRTCQESRRDNVDVQPAVLSTTLADEQELGERDATGEDEHDMPSQSGVIAVLTEHAADGRWC